jgi:F-type H+-transporting ATPase subunit delta
MAQKTKSKRRAITDSGKRQVARIYARALLQAAQASGAADQVAAELDSLADDVLDPNPHIEETFEHGRLKPEQAESILDRAFRGRASDLVLNFLKVLARRERLNCLRGVIYEFHDQYNQARGHVDVTVRTATPLPADQARQIDDRLRQRLGVEPDLIQILDPELLGGIVLQMGDTVYDGSLSTQIARLRELLLHRSVHEIQSRRDSFRH